MEVKDKILELVELDAKINGMKSQVRDLDESISKAQASVVAANENKRQIVLAKEMAAKNVTTIENKIFATQTRIDDLAGELKESQLLYDEAKKGFDSYTEDIINQPDDDIKNLNSGIAKLEDKKKVLVDTIVAEQKKLDTIRQELKSKGYELNIFGDRGPAPTTTYM